MKRFFLIAGEVSGDLHGSRLMEALRSLDHGTVMSGVGGPLMRQEGLETLFPMEKLQVMGFSDVLKSLPTLWKLFYAARNEILKHRPDGVILIDYPGFNLRLGKALRKGGYKGKIIQYICPSIWAHGKERIELLSRNFDLVLSIYPFEAAYFSGTPLKVEYVGNPLADTIRTHHYRSNWKKGIGLSESQEIIALFPGSRRGEIERHLPQQLQAAALLKKSHPHLHFALSCSQESLKGQIMSLVQQGPLPFIEGLTIVPSHERYELMRSSHSALAKSGSVTLELALHSVPSTVHYDLTFVNYMMAKYVLQLKLPHYCIVNILRNRSIFPELMGRNLSSAVLKQLMEDLYANNERRNEIKAECEKLKMELGNQPTHQCAAQAIQRLIAC